MYFFFYIFKLIFIGMFYSVVASLDNGVSLANTIVPSGRSKH